MNRKMMKNRFIQSALLSEDVGKIELYGDILDEKPRNWWTDEVIEDYPCITPKDFSNALEELQNVSTIEIHLNSGGGVASAGIAIGNKIKHSDKHFICIVDSIAASAAFTVAMSCDEVHVFSSSILMCHEVKVGLNGYYNNADLKRVEIANETYNKSTASVYSKKSGMELSEILELMAQETWMTGTEAVEKGFADKELEGNSETTVQLLNQNMLMVNGVQCNIKGLKVPDRFLNSTNKQLNVGGQKTMSKKDKEKSFMQHMAAFFKNEADEEDKKTDQDGEDDEDKKGKKENKSANQDDGNDEEKKEQSIKEERARLQAIDAIADKIDADLVQEAKYGETACSAEQLALRALQRDNEKSKEALTKLQKDSNASGVNDVSSLPPNTDTTQTEDAIQKEATDSMKILFNKINKENGGK